MRTVEPIEILWVIELTPGFLFCLFNLWDAWQDLRSLRRRGIDSIAPMVAKGSITLQVFLLVIFILLELAGVGALLSPPTTPDPSVASFRDITIGIFMLFALVLTSMSISIYVGRKRVLGRIGVLESRLSVKTLQPDEPTPPDVPLANNAS